jgi:hypothetical protein
VILNATLSPSSYWTLDLHSEDKASMIWLALMRQKKSDEKTRV